MTGTNRRTPGKGAEAPQLPAVTWYWTWGGSSFGYREGNALFTFDGLEVGRFFNGREIYGVDGRYIGELGTGNDCVRLITNMYKASRAQAGFVPTLGRTHRQRANKAALPLYSGHLDFPSAQSFKAQLSGLGAYAASPA
jgi:hypothetical protein